MRTFSCPYHWTHIQLSRRADRPASDGPLPVEAQSFQKPSNGGVRSDDGNRDVGDCRDQEA